MSSTISPSDRIRELEEQLDRAWGEVAKYHVDEEARVQREHRKYERWQQQFDALNRMCYELGWLIADIDGTDPVDMKEIRRRLSAFYAVATNAVYGSD